MGMDSIHKGCGIQTEAEWWSSGVGQDSGGVLEEEQEQTEGVYIGHLFGQAAAEGKELVEESVEGIAEGTGVGTGVLVAAMAEAWVGGIVIGMETAAVEMERLNSVLALE